jgi:hypothetical protein
VICRLLPKSLLAAAISSVGVLALTVAPAAAVPGSASGVVTGTIHLTPGIPTGNVCATQAFTFQEIAIAGVITAGANQAAGKLNADPITGGTSAYPLPLPPPIGCVGAQENVLAAAGTINPFGFRSVGTLPFSAFGTCAGGTYLRIATVVLVDLVGCSANVGPSTTTFFPPGALRVAALFVPDWTKGSNGVTTPVGDALFAGAFAGVGQ